MPDLDYGYEVTIAQNATSDPAASSVTNQWQRQIFGNTNWENIVGETGETYEIVSGDRSAKIRLQQDLDGAKVYSNELQVTSENPSSSIDPGQSSNWHPEALDSFISTDPVVYAWGQNAGNGTHLVAQFRSWAVSPDSQESWTGSSTRLDVYSTAHYDISLSSDGEDWFYTAGDTERFYRKSGGNFNSWLKQSGSYSGRDVIGSVVTSKHYAVIDYDGGLYYTSKSSPNGNYVKSTGSWSSLCYNKKAGLYFATDKATTGNVYKSSNLVNWEDTGFNAGGSAYGSGVIADRGGEDIIFTFNSISKAMYRSTDQGSSWTTISTGNNYGPKPLEFTYDSRMPGEYKGICYLYAKGFGFLKENGSGIELLQLPFLNPSNKVPILVSMSPHQFIIMIDGSASVWSTKYAS